MALKIRLTRAGAKKRPFYRIVIADTEIRAGLNLDLPTGVSRLKTRDLAAIQDEDLALVLQRLKALALERRVALVVVSQLPRFDAKRPNARPALDDFGHLGAIKQHADVVLGIYREDMYNPGYGVEGATELIVLKNRNGPTGAEKLAFLKRFAKFADLQAGHA